MLLHRNDRNLRLMNRVYQMEMDANDDERELAETGDTAGITTKLVLDLGSIEALLQDYNNYLASLNITIAKKDIPSTSKLLTKAMEVSSVVASTDFNDFSPDSVDRVSRAIDNINNLIQFIQSHNLTPRGVASAREFYRQVGSITANILEVVSPMITMLSSRLVNRRQTISVLEDERFAQEEEMYGGGYYDRYGFMEISQYQPKRWV